MNTTRTALGAVSLAALLALTACGGDNSGDGADPGSDTASDAASDAGDGAPTDRPGGGFDPEQLEAIQQCLEAAGLEADLPTDRPSGVPTDLPSDFPTDLPSDFSGAPSDFPSDFPTDFSGGPGGGAFQDPEVQAALEACGIELPDQPGQS